MAAALLHGSRLIGRWFGARLACAGSHPERIWLSAALLTIAFDAGAGDSRPLPAGFETLIEREPLTLSAEPASRAPLAVVPSAPGPASQPSADPATFNPPGAALSREARSLAPFEPASPLGIESLHLESFTANELAPREFRPRPPSLMDAQRSAKSEDSLMSDSDIWQHLANDYRIQRRVRVLTLWDAGWSSLSLQAGRHGDPSIQWSGHLLGRSEAHRGVLDRWVPKLSGPVVEGRGIAHALGGLARAPGAAAPRAGGALP